MNDIQVEVYKNEGFTIMSNHHLRNHDLSFKAKGMLSFFLSLPPDWDYSIRGLVSISKESTKAIRNGLKELEDNKYLIREKMNLSNGRFKYKYKIFELPYDSPYYQKGYAVNGNTLNGSQINTNIINTKEQIEKNDKKDKTKNLILSEYNLNEARHNPFVIDLIKSGYINEDEYNIVFYNDLFNDYVNRGYSIVDIYSVMHYVVPKVIENNFKDENNNDITNKFGYLKSSMARNFKKFEDADKPLWPELEDDEWEL